MLLTWLEPPGFEVDTISNEDYRRRTSELGEQLRHPSD
jgi:hypothetical protein